jgi:hypothetical protein
LAEIEKLYETEKQESEGNAKKLKEMQNLYESNKVALVEEFNRLK